MSEPGETRLKRLRIRSWRRGTKEMDLILGGWSDAHLATLDEADLDLYEAVLRESDLDLYRWITQAAPPPDRLAPLLNRIAAEAAAAQAAKIDRH